MHPESTYRLQIRAAFDLDAAAAVTGYLRDIGVGWAYLSPLLQSTSGSDHGYDVVDPTRVDPARGGAEGLERFAAAARAAGLGILIDTVPNHMGIAVPAENPWWWDVLLRGRDSRYAAAFDIDWEFGGGKVRVPVLGSDADEIIDAMEIRVDPAPTALAPHGTVRYFDHEFPLAEGTAPAEATSYPDAVRQVLARQHFELMFWQLEASELNYRRFFAVSTLAGVRVEDPVVFDEAHEEVARWFREGLADGLRIDHPDGLVDPGGYLERLGSLTGRRYTLVEKILEHSATEHPELLPAWWDTDGTTGYDAMAEIDRVLIDPDGEGALDALDERLRRATGLRPAQPWPDLIHDTKRMIADTIQGSEIARLVRCLPEHVALAAPDAADALAEILACFPVYRSYLPAGREALDEALAEASARRPDLAAAIDTLSPFVADPALEVARRFQQTTGPVMAKGVEDTAFYRATRLGTLTEVGGDPSVFSLSVAGLHEAFARRQAQRPTSMTSLSTHDTKRGEDVRARLSVLAEIPHRWANVLEQLRGIASTGHGPFDALLWQAIIGSWPLLSACTPTPRRQHGKRQRQRPGGIPMPTSSAGYTPSSTLRTVKPGSWSRLSSPRSRSRGGVTRCLRSSCRWLGPEFPTCPRGPSCGRPRSSTPTIAAPSTSRSARRCSPSSTVASPRGTFPPSTLRGQRSSWSPRARCGCGATGPGCSRAICPSRCWVRRPGTP